MLEENMYKLYQMPDVVMGTQLNLRRNLINHRFRKSACSSELKDIKEEILSSALELDFFKNGTVFSMENCDFDAIDMFLEKGFIDEEFKESSLGVILVSRNRKITLVINGEDHISLFINCQDDDIFDSWETLSNIDDELEKKLGFSFGPKYGYHCSKISNSGTGFTVTYFLHIPMLTAEAEDEDLDYFCEQYNISIENSIIDSSGISDYSKIENEQKIGLSEDEIIVRMETAAVQISERERFLREKVIQKKSIVVEDGIKRACAVLRNAKLITFHETERHLSFLRLGIEAGLIKGLSLKKADSMFSRSTPAYIHNCIFSTDPIEEDKFRAEQIQKQLPENIKFEEM
ncbi:Putative ATP:guanido phosphotransferase [Sedimentisphaera cyanobacteriorum]|uniref:ATP:guanido phosphotransferase n=1 Tax=Sedimentisphaera cyanobacteriorum TaxID=1940790 RepID=A0A1Q2HPU9_9BACT|nr:hypothetical protein [Sedimentisphaera cyanobacteriorum]AQQ09351.1 Putative ATP:guanido phosphotransferase [Sedimentisphaera cyanobacteriorum]